MPPFPGVILPITVWSRDVDSDRPLEEWARLRDDFANYRLNSSPLVSEAAKYGVGKPSTWGESESVRPRIANKRQSEVVIKLTTICNHGVYSILD